MCFILRDQYKNISLSTARYLIFFSENVCLYLFIACSDLRNRSGESARNGKPNQGHHFSFFLLVAIQFWQAI